MATLPRMLAVRHANGVKARIAWNNEELVQLREPYAAAHSLIANTADSRKEIRDHGWPLASPPYLICTTWEGKKWTYVNAIPDEILIDDIIERSKEAFVVHMWPDVKTATTILRMHKRGTLAADIVLKGIDGDAPFEVLNFNSKAIGPGWLKYCSSLKGAMAELVGQLGLEIDRAPAVVADGGKMRLTCDPADIDSVRLTQLRAWSPELDVEWTEPKR